MSAGAFIDTNVFTYHLDSSDPREQLIAENIVRNALAGSSACISYQVVQEWLNVAVKKAAVPLAPEQARSSLDVVLLPLMQVAPSGALYHHHGGAGPAAGSGQRLLLLQPAPGSGLRDTLVR